MTKMKTRILLSIICLSLHITTQAQDSLTKEQLLPLSHSFQIEDGKMSGPGAIVLKKAMSETTFVMLGEYHGSKRISEFTEAVIPVLDSLGCKSMVLEVGPHSGRLLNEMDNVELSLKELNNKYKKVDEYGDVDLPIPFCSSVEDAKFLSMAKQNDWSLYGIDQEYYHGFELLVEVMYNNLDPSLKSANRSLYQSTLDSLELYYKLNSEGERRFAVSVFHSATMQAFLKSMSQENKNVKIAEDIMESTHIYKMIADKQWYENNVVRSKYMKKQLRIHFEENKFDVTKDKLLVKMGGYHLSKGLSPLGVFDVGNALNEIAEYNGNTALNIIFSTRYYVEDGELKDVMKSDKIYHQRLRDLNQMGKSDEWVLIDMRSIIKGNYFHPVIYNFDKYTKDVVMRYDMLVIPKKEVDGTPNYDIK